MSSQAQQDFSWLHAHPELSGQERRTAAYAASRLRETGWSVREGVGGHGVVAHLTNGPGRHVGLRAELDALPHRSVAGDVEPRHTCGHDLHLACLLSAAQWLSEHRRQWSGTVTALCQPAEETLAGAAAMVADDVFRAGRPDLLLAQHSAPFPAGYVAVAPGPVLAGSRVLSVRIRGVGGHAAAAGATSPVVTAAAAIGRLQTVITGETGPAEPAVLTVGALDAPEPPGIVPAEVGFQVGLRGMNVAALDRLEAATRRVVRAEGVASGHPQPTDVERLASSTALVNDPDLAQTVARGHRERLGAKAVLRWVPSMATEDFATLASSRSGMPDVPVCYWMLGCADPDVWQRLSGSFADRLGAIPGNHSPDFAVDARAVDVGVSAMCSAALAALDASANRSTAA